MQAAWQDVEASKPALSTGREIVKKADMKREQSEIPKQGSPPYVPEIKI
jgi:hypothetical protein